MPSSGIFSPGLTTISVADPHLVDAARARRCRRAEPAPSAGARSISARIAPRARSIARVSSSCASANRKTTEAASDHSPSATAPQTATTIRTLMSSTRARSDARRGGPDECRRARRRPQTAASRARQCPASDAQQARGEQRRRTATTSRCARSRPRWPTRGSSCSSHARMPVCADRFGDTRGRQVGGVVLHTKALADDVGVERFEPGQRASAGARGSPPPRGNPSPRP